MQRQKAAVYVLTAGLVLVFVYFGIDKFLQPILWIGWIPAGFEGLLGLTRDTWLQIVGIVEILLGVSLVIPVRNVQRAGALATSLFLVMILTQVGVNDMGARDAGLLCASVALFLLL